MKYFTYFRGRSFGKDKRSIYSRILKVSKHFLPQTLIMSKIYTYFLGNISFVIQLNFQPMYRKTKCIVILNLQQLQFVQLLDKKKYKKKYFNIQNRDKFF